MCLIKAAFFIFVLQRALADDPLIHPCSKKDIPCLSKTAQEFLGRTSAGIPQYDILPIDPWKDSEIKVPVATPGITVSLKNVSVVGLKKLKINNFKIDAVSKYVVLGMEDDAEISADIVVEKDGQIKSSPYSSRASKLPTASYSYDLVPNKEGVEYFTVGPDTIFCEIEGKPDGNVNEEVAKILFNDPATEEEIKKNLICSVIVPVFHTVIHNLRASAKIYPKTAYFTDL